MPDDNDDSGLPEGHPLGFLIGMSRPDPEAMKRHQMAHEDHMARIDHFFKEVSAEHLVTFRDLMQAVLMQHDPKEYVSYLQGKADAVLSYVHDVCPSCGKDHLQEELLQEGERE